MMPPVQATHSSSADDDDSSYVGAVAKQGKSTGNINNNTNNLNNGRGAADGVSGNRKMTATSTAAAAAASSSTATPPPNWIDHLVDVAGNQMDRIFSSCADDPRGSVHRSWGMSLLFVVLFFALSILEMWNLRSAGSAALFIASILIGLCHLVLGILGTFVLKRFPTSFSVGFLLGIVLILANQNLIFFGTFYRYDYGNSNTNHLFGVLGFVLALILFFFGILLFHFRNDIVVAPVNAGGSKTSKGHHNSSSNAMNLSMDNNKTPPIAADGARIVNVDDDNHNTNYERYDDDDEDNIK